jgi:hypothetical protein
MEQLLAHLFGDYVIQNSWMANNKEKRTFPCIIHCLTYSLCFAFISSWQALLVIFTTHFFIDRFGLAKNWKLKGMNENTPDYIKFFVSVAVDNTIHLLINFLAIKYMNGPYNG